jgi:hypothetical protein
VQRHADLIHRDKGRIGSEFAQRPGEFEQRGNNIRKRRDQGEKTVLASDALHNVAGHGRSEQRKGAGQRQFELLIFGKNQIDQGTIVVRFEEIAVARNRHPWLAEHEIETFRVSIDGVNGTQSLGLIGAVHGGRCEKSFHSAEGFFVRGHQAHVQVLMRRAADLVGIEPRINFPDVVQNIQWHRIPRLHLSARGREGPIFRLKVSHFVDDKYSENMKPVIVVLLVLSSLLEAGDNGSRVLYVGGTVAGMSMKSGARIEFLDDDAFQLTAKGLTGKDKAVRIPFADVTAIEYGMRVSRRYVEAVLISPVFLIAKKRTHYLTIGYADEHGQQQAMVLQVGKDEIRTLLVSLEARTGRRVEYQDEEARKAGKG